MLKRAFAAILAFAGLFTVPAVLAEDGVSVVVSIPEQRLYIFTEDGRRLASFRVSTSKFGLGDGNRSYATPLGRLEIAAKYGHGAEIGRVFRHCRPTREICPINAPGRDPIVTRVITLRGLERQNSHALSRGIYIHGTPDERHIGRPVSYGCIRMKSRDVLEVFAWVQRGTPVEITTERVGNLFGHATRPSPERG